MNFEDFLKKYNAQKKINKLVKKYKNKKIAVYGAGQFARAIFERYNISGLNIVAVADIKFENNNQSEFFNYKCISPNALGDIDCDVILIANFDYNYFLTKLDDHILYLSKNENIEVRPFINLTFKDLFLSK